jgi:hypothetical protein
MTPDTVRRLALKSIGLADSFIVRSRLQCHLPSYIDEKDQTVIGVYINNSDSQIIISERGLTVIDYESKDRIPFKEITHIMEPIEGEQDLDLLLECDRWDDVRSLSIPILGVTNNFPDINEFYNFLQSVMKHLQISPINLRSIHTRKDLVDFLKTECEWEYYTSALATYLDNDSIESRFEDFQIDKDMLSKPDFWRAIAVILGIPTRMPVDKVRDPDDWVNRAQFDR